MPNFINKKVNAHLDEVMRTIKMIEVEERYDIYFSRFFGLYFAKIGRWLRMTPTHISIISLIVGVIGGFLLYYQDQVWIVAIGGFLVVWAGVLDSSDGQLARMTGQSTELGRIIDGLIDNLVFISCYLAGALYFLPTYDWWIMGLAVLAGYAHSLKSAIYDFYKGEFLFLAGGIEGGSIPISVDEFKPTGNSLYHRIMNYLYVDYIKKQLKFTTRTKEERAKFIDYSKQNKNDFRKEYSRLNERLLFWWAWLCGSNTHRNALIVFALIGRFDLYLWSSILWTIGIIPVSLYQRKIDRKLLEKMN